MIPCIFTGPIPIEVHEGIIPGLDPAPTAAVPGADLVAGNTADAGATATPQCRTVADTLATGY